MLYDKAGLGVLFYQKNENPLSGCNSFSTFAACINFEVCI
jgi:hypothetical protein